MYTQNPLLKMYFQPIFYFLLLFASGIFIEKVLDLSINLLAICLVSSLLLIVYSYFLKIEKLITIFLMLGFLLVGGLLEKIESEKISFSMEKVDKEIYATFIQNQEIEIYAEVLGYPKETPSGITLGIKTHFINKTGRPIAFVSTAHLTLLGKSTDYQENRLMPGTYICFLGELFAQERFKNPGVTSNRQILIQQGYDFAVGLKNPNTLKILYYQPSNFHHIYQIRKYFFKTIEQNFSDEKAGVLKAIVLGDDDYLNVEVTEKFRASGLYHILVISGSHIAFLTWLFYKLISVITRNRITHFAVVNSLMWTYVLVIGLQTPIVRAAIMATIVLGGNLLYRKANPSNSIGIAGLVLLSYHPKALFEASFQLTFVAVSLILLLVVPLVNKLEKIGRWYPTKHTPYPPECSYFVKFLAESLFWSQKNFEQKQKHSSVKYHLEKTFWASLLEKYKLQAPLRNFFILLIINIVVELGLLPLSIIYFHRVVFINVIFNIFSELLMSLLLVLFIVFIIVDCIFNTIAQYLIVILDSVLTIFIQLSWPEVLDNLNKKINVLSYRIAGLPDKLVIFYVFYFVLIILLIIKIDCWEIFLKPIKLVVIRQYNKYFCSKYLLIVWLICLLIITIPQHFYKNIFKSKTNELEVVFLDVGQGDAIFIKFPKGTTMMIDSGGSTSFGKEKKIGRGFSIGEQVDSVYLWSRGIEQLDYIATTHPHNDHMQGFREVVKNFSVGQAITSSSSAQEWQPFFKLLSFYNIPINFWSSGQTYFIDGVKIEVLWPNPNIELKKNLNNLSLVIKITYQGHSILLTGDIEKEVETFLVNTQKDLTSEVLKSPHHGSKTSSRKSFLDAVKPNSVIVSAPIKSQFGHPHKEVLERYTEIGAKIYQTSVSGAVTVKICDGKLDIKEFGRQN